MDGFLQILTLIGFMAAGALFVRLRWAPSPRITDRLLKCVLWSLLFVMGFRTGNDPAVASNIGTIGLLAAATAVLAYLGTAAAIVVGYGILTLHVRRTARPAPDGAAAEDGSSSVCVAPKAVPSGRGRRESGSRAQLKASMTLLAVVAAGGAAGAVLPALEGFDFGRVTGWVLDALLFFVGIQFAQAGISLKAAFLRPETIMIPLATAIGSLAGGLALAPLFHLATGSALSLAAGFGWYSLAGVLIADLGDPGLGSAAFLANLFRESLALLTIPLLARTRYPYLAIGAGGATSMDVTLPLIEQCVGPECVPVSFASGALLSLSVPVLVPFLFRIG
jgi:uncharacterized membrane protein YbjE (DUF340 family)